MLLQIAGKPLVIHTLERVREAKSVTRIIAATDDARIFAAVEKAGFEPALTSPHHRSGSDRIAEVATGLPENSLIVNVQGDEPLISPRTIDAAVNGLINDSLADISTTCETVETGGDVTDTNVVKVVSDVDGYALYFSRSLIPFPRDAVNRHGSLTAALTAELTLLKLFRKHTGLYVYRREFLLKYNRMERTAAEDAEMLEQLRALEHGAKIKVVEVAEKSIGVDTPADFERVSKLLAGDERVF